MSAETKLFRPPTSYPEAPKDMYYEVPAKSSSPPKPKPIFPWEAHAPKPTRVFADEEPLSPYPQPEPEPAPTTSQESAPSDRAEASPPMVGSPPGADWGMYNRGNAWDDVPEIDRYVKAFVQSRRGPVQVLHQTSSPGGTQSITSPPAATPRRPSMKLTDFPTEIERPSLPVTPAPIRRPSFWGEERDALGELPAAEGVPKQDEWVRGFQSYPTLQFQS